MPEEHGGHVGFSHVWREIQSYSDSHDPLKSVPAGYNHYDEDIFTSVWGPVLASLFYGKSFFSFFSFFFFFFIFFYEWKNINY